MTSVILAPVSQDSLAPRSVPVREYVAGGRIKGGILRAHLRWAREHADPDTFRTLLDALPPARVADLSNLILATSWYPLQWLVDLDRAIISRLGEGDRTILRSTGQFAARSTLRHVRESLLREDPHTFLRHVSLLQSHFTDFGTSTWEQLGSSFGRMTHRHWRCFSPTLCASSAGFYEDAVRMSGSLGVTVDEMGCQCRGDKHCTFLVRWNA
ncbi:MAG: hypothetical protein HYU52_07660 [Acidobacteria bacterium]|nr:hypothetical protein [Acidobacteriota bacterium]